MPCRPTPAPLTTQEAYETALVFVTEGLPTETPGNDAVVRAFLGHPPEWFMQQAYRDRVLGLADLHWRVVCLDDLALVERLQFFVEDRTPMKGVRYHPKTMRKAIAALVRAGAEARLGVTPVPAVFDYLRGRALDLVAADLYALVRWAGESDEALRARIVHATKHARL